MVIPYMPMLVPPVNWTGYDNFSYVVPFLPNFKVVLLLMFYLKFTQYQIIGCVIHRISFGWNGMCRRLEAIQIYCILVGLSWRWRIGFDIGIELDNFSI